MGHARLATRRLAFLLPLLLLASAFVFTGMVPRAHASLVGLVCLQDPSSPRASSGSPCSASPRTFDGPAPGAGQAGPTQIRIGVYLNASDAMNAFDITLLTNHTILNPAGVDITGTVVPGQTTVVDECLHGNSVVGKCAATDTNDTLHFSLVGLGGLTTAPTSGLLFVAIYNITGTAVTSGITVGFQTGCVQSSSGSYCVTIATGTSIPRPETIQAAASFNNHTPPPWVAISSNVTALTLLVNSNLGNQAKVTATAKSGWPGISTDRVSFSTIALSGLTGSFSAQTCATGGTFCSPVLTLSGVAGNYSLTVIGQYVLTDTSFAGQTDTLTVPMVIQVTIRDFGLTANPASLSFNAGATSSSSLTLSSLNGFSGTVGLSVSCFASSSSGGGSLGGGGGGRIEMAPIVSCPPVSVSPSVVSVPKGGSASSTLTMSSPNWGGSYTIYLAGQTGPASAHGISLGVVISDFNVSVSPTAMAVAVTSSVISTLQLTSLNNFVGTVSLSATVFPGVLTVSFSSSSLALTAGGSASSNVTISALTGTPTGSYDVEIVASSGGSYHTVTILVLVKAQGMIAIFVRALSQSGISGVLGLVSVGIVAALLVGTPRSESQSPRRAKRRIGAHSTRPAIAFSHYQSGLALGVCLKSQACSDDRKIGRL